jgi:peptide-methionine (S)-S-oxide reductase
MIRSVVVAVALAAGSLAPLPALAETRSLVVAGGCFWCVEKDFDHVPGVVATTSGYSGGTMENPTYQSHTGHREVVKIDYDSTKTDYATLVTIFFRSIDPTDEGGQFCDRGHAYTTAVTYTTDEEKAAAEKAKADAQAALGQTVVTPVEKAATFWQAEDYHQNYYKKNPIRYAYYRGGCGRDARVEQVWGAAAHQGIEGT